jgi:hypothetical protein
LKAYRLVVSSFFEFKTYLRESFAKNLGKYIYLVGSNSKWLTVIEA